MVKRLHFSPHTPFTASVALFFDFSWVCIYNCCHFNSRDRGWLLAHARQRPIPEYSTTRPRRRSFFL